MKYKEWDSDLIVDWILSLDQEYQRYEEALRKNMKDEGMDGSLLGELGIDGSFRNDLHRWGISQMKHKIDIVTNVKRLITQQSQSQSQQAAPPAVYINDHDGPNSTAYI